MWRSFATLHPPAWEVPPPRNRSLTSDAGHDAMIVAPHLPAAMLFLRTPGGLSHHPDEREIASTPLLGDEGIRVRALLGSDPQFDFAVNTMEYDPGARLSMVEVHVMEHGLLMLQGEGIYRLGDAWYPVTAGDFIWMGPFCPQWFGALGTLPARYLIYKDWNRHPLASSGLEGTGG